MGCQVRFSPGHDIFYLPSQARSGGEGESTTGGYYVNAAQAGEAPGRWLGKGAAALGLAEGTEVDPDVHEMVFSQVDPHDGVTTLGRAPAKDTAEKRAQREAELERLLAAEPHATEARKHELERQAAQMHRASLPYTDFTVTYSKSVSVVHASIRENARRAAMAGDLAGEAWWADVQARYAGILFDAAAEAMRHLDKWAVTRVGMGRKVDDQQLGRYEDAGLVASMWLQGTSRDGDPHDHVHNAIARMSLTSSDDQWRAVDTWALRQQGGVAKLLANAYHPAAFTRGLSLGWVSTPDGTEVDGVTQEQKDAYSTRKQVIDRETARKCAEFEREHGRAPARSEVRALRKLAEAETRKGKDDAPIDWDELAAQWDAQYGGDLAQIALDLGLGPGGAAQARAGLAGDAAGARDQFAALLPIRERVLGREQPKTLITRGNLAQWTGLAGDAAGARDLFAALLPVRERASGPEHPDTLTARASLARWTGTAGDAAGARDQFAALLPIRERVLGPEHPANLTTQHNLAYWTGTAGDAAGARDELAALLPIRERVLGPEHPETLITRAHLAYWTGQAGDAAGARDQYAALLPMREQVSGPEHPDTLTARAYLARFTGQAGDAAGARDQFVALLRVVEPVSGLEHPDTQTVRADLAYWTEQAGMSRSRQHRG